MTEQQRLKKPLYPVHWRARIMTLDRAVADVVITFAAKSGLCVHCAQMVSVGAAVNIEFFVKYRGQMQRIRAKTTVVYCRLLSRNEGVVLELRFSYISNEEMHVFNNVLQLLANSTGE